MAIILEAAYRKKPGLPNFSSRSYVVSIRTELPDLTQVEADPLCRAGNQITSANACLTPMKSL